MQSVIMVRIVHDCVVHSLYSVFWEEFPNASEFGFQRCFAFGFGAKIDGGGLLWIEDEANWFLVVALIVGAID